MDYKKLNDYELIYQVRENDEVAYGLLIDKYSNLINIMAKKYQKQYKNIGLEFDDLYQEGMIGVIKALKDYNSNDTLFFTYAGLCAKREMDRLVKSQSRKKRMILNNSISLNHSINDDPDFLLENLIPSNYDLEKEFEISDELKKIMDKKYDLNIIDSSIFELKMNGFSVREIANLLELSYKIVDYRIRKIRKKIITSS